MALWVIVGVLGAGAIALVPIVLNTLARRPEYDLFISFATPDLSMARVVATRARERGIRYFLSDQSLVAGDHFPDRIRKAIRNAAEMAVLCTPASIASRWVRDEWSIGVAGQKRVTPILQGCEPRDLSELLREFQAVPFEGIDDFLNQVVRPRGVGVRQPVLP